MIPISKGEMSVTRKNGEESQKESEQAGSEEEGEGAQELLGKKGSE